MNMWDADWCTGGGREATLPLQTLPRVFIGLNNVGVTRNSGILRRVVVLELVVLLLMEEILHHLGCIKPWYKLPMISSTNSRTSTFNLFNFSAFFSQSVPFS